MSEISISVPADGCGGFSVSGLIAREPADEAPPASDPIPESASRLLRCMAHQCRFNDGAGGCSFSLLEIGNTGICAKYEERTEEQLREYLARMGIGAEAINYAVERLGRK